jgi:hypothetical protein
MSLKIEIYLPKKSLNDLDELESFFIDVGDIVAKDYGNKMPESFLNIENLDSFIIIKEDEIPNPENFQDEDMFLVIPVED